MRRGVTPATMRLSKMVLARIRTSPLKAKANLPKPLKFEARHQIAIAGAVVGPMIFVLTLSFICYDLARKGGSGFTTKSEMFLYDRHVLGELWQGRLATTARAKWGSWNEMWAVSAVRPPSMWWSELGPDPSVHVTAHKKGKITTVRAGWPQHALWISIVEIPSAADPRTVSWGVYGAPFAVQCVFCSVGSAILASGSTLLTRFLSRSQNSCCCQDCGYSLRASRSSSCPECGCSTEI